mmetsp:Transcript_3618/g.14656  ORF Transcript_3618/g.14656 Transcript_3618/m.14656 type:complete len:403 (-) Transcript_3618:77-1285(-)
MRRARGGDTARDGVVELAHVEHLLAEVGADEPGEHDRCGGERRVGHAEHVSHRQRDRHRNAARHDGHGQRGAEAQQFPQSGRREERKYRAHADAAENLAPVPLHERALGVHREGEAEDDAAEEAHEYVTRAGVDHERASLVDGQSICQVHATYHPVQGTAELAKECCGEYGVHHALDRRGQGRAHHVAKHRACDEWGRRGHGHTTQRQRAHRAQREASERDAHPGVAHAGREGRRRRRGSIRQQGGSRERTHGLHGGACHRAAQRPTWKQDEQQLAHLGCAERLHCERKRHQRGDEEERQPAREPLHGGLEEVDDGVVDGGGRLLEREQRAKEAKHANYGRGERHALCGKERCEHLVDGDQRSKWNNELDIVERLVNSGKTRGSSRRLGHRSRLAAGSYAPH